MRRSLALLAFVTLVGCGQTPAAKYGGTASDDEPVPDFSAWPRAVCGHPAGGFGNINTCLAPSEEWKQRSRAADRAGHGPHKGYRITVRTNPAAFDDFKAFRPLATGSIVIKEKYYTAGVNPGVPTEYMAMVKREPGYDPDNGDWEFAAVVRGPSVQTARGRLTSCAGCHAEVADKDHLFRNYVH